MNGNENVLPPFIRAMNGRLVPPTHSFLVTVNRRQIAIPGSEVLYFEADGFYTKVHTTFPDTPYLIRACLNIIEQQAPATHFCRIHRSYIIGIYHFDQIEKDLVNIAKKDLTLSRQYRGRLQERLRMTGFISLGEYGSNSGKTDVTESGLE